MGQESTGSGVDAGVPVEAGSPDAVGPIPLTDVVEGGFEVAWAMVDASPDALVMVDEGGLIKLVNRQSEVLFGYDRGELLGRPVEALLPADLAGVHQAHRTRFRADPNVRVMGSGLDLLARRSDGSTFPVEISLSPLTVEGELRVIAAVRDITERVAAQAVAERTRKAIDSIRDGVYLFDPVSLRFAHVNQGAASQSGYRVTDLLDGMGPLHLLPAFTRTRFEELLAPLVNGDTPTLSYETVLRHRSGRDCPVDVVMDYPDVDGHVDREPGDVSDRVVVAVVRDSSDRVAAEEQARLVQNTIDAVSDAVFMCDEETLAFSYVNEGAVVLHGFSREELLGGMTPADLAPTLEPTELQAALKHLASTPGASARLRTDGRRKDGTTVPVDVEINWPAPGHPGGPRPVMAVVRDISAQVAVERAIEASEARFRAAFDEGPVPMAIVEVVPPAGRVIVDVNQALADLFGYCREELLGRPAADLIHPADVHPDTSLASAVASGLDVDYDHLVRGIRADGSEIWLQRHVSALDPDGDQDKLVVHVVDVTARIEAEAAQRRQEALTAALSSVRLDMLRGASRYEGLVNLCRAARDLLGAVGAVILTPTGVDDGLVIEAAVGVPESIQARMSFRSSQGAVGEVFRTGQPQHLNSGRHPTTSETNREVLDEHQVGPLLLAPLPGGDGVAGVLIVIRLAAGDDFTDASLDPARQLAAGAVTAIELAQARTNESNIRLLEDRDRIGRDMHDNVIGRLFGIGMSLQAVLAISDGNPALTGRIGSAVQDIDAAIKEIRTAIYGVRASTDWGKGTRGEVLAVIADQNEGLGFEPTVTLDGPIDDLADDVAEDLLAVIREALTNATKYAQASAIKVAVTCGAATLDVEIVDNGAGFSPAADETGLTGNGLRNIVARAEAHGGTAGVSSEPGRGTTVTWSVPLPR